GHGSLTVGAKQQIAAFLNQSPFNVAAPVRGTFTFTSSLPISAVGFRGFTNELGEFLITTLPMASITSASVENLNFPQFVDGAGWSTQVILVNPASVSLTGTVHLYNTNGTENSPAGGMPYSIAPRSCFVLRTNDPEKPIEVKSVQVRSNQGQIVPSGLVLFSFTNRGITVAETGVGPAAAGTAFRLYVENADDSVGTSAIQTGIAIANPSSIDPASVRIEAFARDGKSTGATTTITIPAFGQMSAFVNQILASVPREFKVVLRITASVPVAVMGLRGRRNERGDFLTTSTPPA